MGQEFCYLPFANGETSNLMAPHGWQRCDPWSRRGSSRASHAPRGPPGVLMLCPAVSSASAGSPQGRGVRL